MLGKKMNAPLASAWPHADIRTLQPQNLSRAITSVNKGAIVVNTGHDKCGNFQIAGLLHLDAARQWPQSMHTQPQKLPDYALQYSV
jgi:hypothetical protein